MRTAWLLATLVACGPPPTPPTISNTAKTPPSSGRPSVAGTIIDLATEEKLVGVTVVVNDQKDAVAITDENGQYRIPLPQAGRYRVTIYYLELTVERDVEVYGPAVVDQELDQTWSTRGMSTVRCASPRAKDCRAVK